MIHVYPYDERDDHELEGTTCECCVEIDWDSPIAIIIHSPFEGEFKDRYWAITKEGD